MDCGSFAPFGMGCGRGGRDCSFVGLEEVVMGVQQR